MRPSMSSKEALSLQWWRLLVTRLAGRVGSCSPILPSRYYFPSVLV